jgi:phosphopantetheinyl transferase
MHIVTDPETWDGKLPALALDALAGTLERRAQLRRLAASALGLKTEEVEVAHEPGRAPRLIRPEGAGLFLSSAGRGGLAALALSRTPIGVDVERVEPGRDPPWNVLHPAERLSLEAMPERDRARAFARLWAAKEAYLKAVGTGIAREPCELDIAFDHEGIVSVRDAGRPVRVSAFEAWRAFGGSTFAVCAICLLPAPASDGA